MKQKHKIFTVALAACLTAGGAAAQDLNKEITLDKDFAPVEKKVTKKSTLPAVVKPAKSETEATIDYSDWAQPTAVATSVPTMLPFGYRTSHIFSTKKGYFDLGAGSQANIAGSLGYRFIDQDKLKVGAWWQHNSTWSGKNNTSAFDGLENADGLRLKQMFNDNVVGLDITSNQTGGTLDLGARIHFDNFNYYGGTGTWWDDNKQTLVDVKILGGWRGSFELSGNKLDYHGLLRYNYAGYNKGLDDRFDNGAKQHHVNVNLGAAYHASATSRFGGEVWFDYLNTSLALTGGENAHDDMGMITLNPYYRFGGDLVTAQLGANVNFSFSDGASIRLSPNVKIDLEATPGFGLFAYAQGGKRLNTLSSMAEWSRYSNPLGGYDNTFAPVDAEFGFKVGPFSGFSMRLYGGYGIFKNTQVNYVPAAALAVPFFKDTLLTVPVGLDNRYAPVAYKSWKTDGFKLGAEVSYKYRSWAELTLSGVYAPQDDHIEAGKTYGGYTLGIDRPEYVIGGNLQVYPIKPLTVNVGFDYRGNRHTVLEQLATDGDAITYALQDLDDVVNLKCGASYRFDKMLTIWLQGSNLLGKKWDVTYGQSAQKLSIMGGIALTF